MNLRGITIRVIIFTVLIVGTFGYLLHKPYAQQTMSRFFDDNYTFEKNPTKKKFDNTDSIKSKITTKGLTKFVKDLPIKIDNYTRPESRNGILYWKGEPEFIISVQIPKNIEKLINIARYSKDYPEDVKKYSYYQRHIDKSMADRIGFNAIKINTTWKLFYENDFINKKHPQYQNIKKLWSSYTINKFSKNPILKNGIKLREYNYNKQELIYKALKDIPIIVDTFTGHKRPNQLKKRLKYAGLSNNVMWTDKRGNIGGGEFPFNLKNQFTVDMISAYWKGVSKWLLDMKANPWVYFFARELHNYNNTSMDYKKGFIKYLKFKFKKIGNLNYAWKTNYNFFIEIIKEEPYPKSRCKGLWLDWKIYMGNEFVKEIKTIKSIFQRVDQRENVYFSFMNAIWFNKANYNSIVDIYEIMRESDIYFTEGGVVFGEYPEGLKFSPFKTLNQVYLANRAYTAQLFLDQGRAISPNQPIFNAELYTRRWYKGINVKIKKSDLIANLWNEVIHGSSGANLFTWNLSKSVDTKEKAMGSTEPYLLNPYLNPPEIFDGISEFKEKLNEIKEIIMPRPRICGEVALLYSRASLWNGVRIENEKGLNYDFFQKLFSAYTGLLFTHYPLDILYEADLWKKKQTYKAIIIPGFSSMFAETYSYLKNYVKTGGVLILIGDAYKYSEYGKDIDISSLTGVKKKSDFIKKDGIIEMAGHSDFHKDIKASSFIDVELVTANGLGVRNFDKKPCITRNFYGMGTVYYIASESIVINALYKIFSILLMDANIEKPFFVTNLNHKGEENIEAQVIDRGDKRLYYLIDWEDFSAKKILLRITKAFENSYIYDVAKKAYITDKIGNVIWSKNSLQEQGLPILLEGQVPSLIVISKKRFKNTERTVSVGELDDRMDKLGKKILGERKNYDDFVKMVRMYRKETN